MLKRWRDGDGDGVNTPHTEITQTKKEIFFFTDVCYFVRLPDYGKLSFPYLPPSLCF